MLDPKPDFSRVDTHSKIVSGDENVAERLLRLQNLARALTHAQSVEQVADVVCAEGFAALQVARGAVYLHAPDGNTYSCARVAGPSDADSEAFSFTSTDWLQSLLSAVQTKQPLIIHTDVVSSPAQPSLPIVPDVVADFFLVLPLLVDDHALGGLILRLPANSELDAETGAFMQVVAQMFANALERAHLFEAERTARQLAEQAMERTSLLQTVTARLAQAVSLSQVSEVIMSEATAILNSHRGVLALLDAEGTHLDVVQAWGYDPDNARAWERFPANAPIPLADVVRSREAVWLHDLSERNARYPQLAQIQTTSQAYAVLPLFVDNQILGGISFGFLHARSFDTDEQDFITALALQCAQAIDRARLTNIASSRLREIEQLNARLQRALAETHHRVKNNLQVISALVELQSDPAQATVPTEALMRVGSHARALATLHDLLTDQAKASQDMSAVSTHALFGKMLPLLQATIGERSLKAQIEDVRLPIRMGASLCLLVNELVSNAVKHGRNEIRLTLNARPDLRQEPKPVANTMGWERRLSAVEDPIAGIVHLTVEDDGPGFPPEFDPIQAAHTGLDLISNLSRLDLGGNVAYANNPRGGARVTLTFPLPAS